VITLVYSQNTSEINSETAYSGSLRTKQ